MSEDKFERVKKAYQAKKDFRVWLVGNQKELGLKDEEWIPAVWLSYEMMLDEIPDKETFQGAFIKYDGETLYFVEAWPIGPPFTEDYKRFIDGGWLEKVRKGDVIREYAVPKDGEARKIFIRAAKIYRKLGETWREWGAEAKRHLEDTMAILNRRLTIV